MSGEERLREILKCDRNVITVAFVKTA